MALENRDAIDLDLKGYSSILKRQWLLGAAVFGATVSAFGFFALSLKPTYTAAAKLLIKSADPALIGLQQPGGEPLQTGRLTSLLETQSPLSTQIEVLTSNSLVQEAINRNNLQNNEGKPISAKDFKEKLDVKIIGATDVIQISYKDSDPQVAANVVNTLMDLYVADNIRRNKAEIVSAREFLVKELPTVEAKLVQAETDLRQFQEQNRIIDLAQEATTTVQDLSVLNQQLATTAAQLNGVTAQVQKLQKQVGIGIDQAIAVNILSRSPEVQGSLAGLVEVEQELADAQQSFEDTHPTVMALKDKKSRLYNTLRQQVDQVFGRNAKIPDGLLQVSAVDGESLLQLMIDSEVQQLQLDQQVRTLYGALSNRMARANNLPQLAQIQKQLQRNVEVAQATYQALLSRLQEVQVVENKTTGNAEVVEAALPPETGSTGRLIFLTLGGLAGLLLATTSMAIADNRDKSLRNLKDIKALFGFPLLGVIPSFDEKSILRESGLDVIASPVLVRDVPGSFISEVYRMIQANLRSLGGDRKLKVVLVTSSVDGEGKSTVAANLAAAMAQLGRNILLVDADLRNPAQHDIWQLSNLEGLSNLLSGQTGVSPTLCPGIEHLEILTAGEVTSNPLALLDTQTMTSLIESAADRYDLIVIDAPSLLTKADALSLSQISDSILLVARPGVVDRESAAMAKETLERSDRNILGLVVNGANRNDFTSSLYYPKLNMVDGEFSHLNQLGATNALSDAGLPAYSEK